MSFRLFIYYCALCGGGAAFLGWGLGRVAEIENAFLDAGIKATLLGMLLAFALGLVDALWYLPLSQLIQVGLRVLIAVMVGCFAGLVGGAIGQGLFAWTRLSLFLVLGWTITGLLLGASIGMFEVIARVVRGQDLGGAIRKVYHGILGGAAGGLLGGVFYLLLQGLWTAIFDDVPSEDLWSPSAMGFVTLGTCIGLFVGLAQVILRVAWVPVDVGFRAGREMILSKTETTIGRGESCDIGLFGDSGVEKVHARIVLRNGQYVLEDTGTEGGTFLNGEAIAKPAPLQAGDRIQVGQSILRFRERQKRVSSEPPAESGEPATSAK